MKAGKFLGKIKDYGFSAPKEGKQPSAVVQFEYMDPADGSLNNITWFGSFNGGAREITTKTLVETFQFNGTTGTEFARGIGSGVIDEQTEYELVLAIETYDGKDRLRVRYVNRPGQSALKKLSTDEASVQIGGLNLAGDLAAARSKMPKPKNFAPGSDNSNKPPF